MGDLARALSVRWRGILKFCLFILIVVSANHFSSYVVEALEFEIRPSNEDLVHRMTMLAATKGTKLKIRATGSDARQAIDSLAVLIETEPPKNVD